MEVGTALATTGDRSDGGGAAELTEADGVVRLVESAATTSTKSDGTDDGTQPIESIERMQVSPAYSPE